MRVKVGAAYMTLIDHEMRVVRLKTIVGREKLVVVELKTGRELERGPVELSKVPEGTKVPEGWGPL